MSNKKMIKRTTSETADYKRLMRAPTSAKAPRGSSEVYCPIIEGGRGRMLHGRVMPMRGDW